MSTESAKSQDVVTADVVQGGSVGAAAAAHGEYHVQCFDKDGNLKWEDRGPNLVVNVGLQDMNTKYFKGSTYTAAWYIGLYGASGSNTPAATDTMSSHVGWTEATPYSNANRPTATFGTATTADPSVINNSASPATFNINATATIGGAFLTSDSTKGGTTGILFSAKNFSGGDRNVVNGDTVNVTYTFNLDAA
jgi:hypothetical protein